MAETSTPTSDAPPIPPAKPKKKKRRWLRWTILIILLLIIGLVALVALGPTIASTAAVRNSILSEANSRFLNGKVEVADWSFGWFSGQTLSGIKVYDDKQSLVAEIGKITTDASIYDAMTHGTFGKTKISGLNVNLRMHPDGKLNIEHIAKAGDNTTPGKPISLDDIQVPNVRGELEIVTGSINLSGAPGVPAAAITELNGTVKVPGGNAPIENQFDMKVAVENGQAGTISTKGSISAIKNGKLVLDTVNGQQNLTIAGIDIASANALLDKNPKITHIGGIADGQFAITLKDGKQATLEAGKLTIAHLTAAGPALKGGDTYSSDSVQVDLPATVLSMPNGPLDFQKMHLKTGSGPDNPITLTLQQGKATAYADVSLASLLNTIKGKAPGEVGRIALTANFDIGKLAGGLRNTFRLAKDAQLTGGTLAANSTIDIIPEKLNLTANADLTDVAGTNVGKPIRLQPIKLGVAASASGGGNVLASIRDIKFDLASAFANGSFTGPTLTSINGNLKGALDKVQAELGQVVDFGGSKLSGTFALNVATKGDLTQTQTVPAQLSAQLAVDLLQIDGLKGQTTIGQKQIRGNLVANILTDANSAPKSIDITQATLTSGDGVNPTLVTAATASVTFDKDNVVNIPQFAVSRFTVDLPHLAADMGAMLPALKNLTGSINAGLNGSIENALKAPKITLAQFSANQSEGLFSAKSTAGSPLTITMPTLTAFPQVVGSLYLDADLARLNQQVKKMTGGKEIAVQSATGDIRSGSISGMLTLSRDEANRTGISADFVTANVSLTTPTGQSPIEPLKLALKASLPDDLSGATIASASATGELLTASATNTQIVLPKKDQKLDPLKLVKSADVSLAIPNLSPVYTLAKAFMPADKPAPTAAPAGPGSNKPSAPMAVTGGSFNVKATVAPGPNDLPTMQVSDLHGENISLSQGTSVYQIASLTGTQAITPSGDVLSPRGIMTLKGVKLMEDGKPAFAEDEVALTNDLSLNIDTMDAVINAFTLKMASSQALALSVKGAVHDLTGQRRIDNIVADVNYVPAAIFKLIRPIIAPDGDSLLANLQLAGKVSRQFVITGQYPANLPFNEAIKQVHATGSFALPSIVLEDSKIEDLDVSFVLADGKIPLTMKPAKFNGGTLDIGGTVIDLTDPVATRLSMPPNKKIVENAAINPFLATNLLGKFVNPAFANPSKATGQLSVTAVACDRIPLDPALLTSTAPANDGKADFAFSIPDLVLGNQLIGAILTATGNSPTINGTVRESHVTIGHGVTTSDITIAAVQGGHDYPLHFTGTVSLADLRLSPMNVSLLTEFLKGRGGDLKKYMPAEISLPITGTTLAPQIHPDEMIGKLIEGALKKQATDLIPNLLNKNKDDKNGDTAKPGDKKENDPLGDLLNQLGKDKKDKKKKR